MRCLSRQTLTICRNEVGTSLLEVITVAALSVVVSFAIYSMFDSIGPIQNDVQHRTELAGEARLTTDAIAKEVRARKQFFGSMDPEHLQMIANRSGGINPFLYYYVEPVSGSANYQLRLFTCAASPCDPTDPQPDDTIRTLTDSIVNGNSDDCDPTGGAGCEPVFSYFDRSASGDQTWIANPDNRPSGTRWVRIHLILDDDSSDTLRRLEIEEDVAIRNN